MEMNNMVSLSLLPHRVLPAIGLLAFASTSIATAQCTKPCWGLNDDLVYDSKISTGGPNLSIAFKIRLPSSIPAQRLEVFTGKRAGAGSVAIWSHDSSGNKPKTKLTSGSYTQNTTVTWQGANLATPQVLIANTDYWFEWSMPNGSQSPIKQRNPSNAGIQYRGSFDGGKTWNGPFTFYDWKLRIFCCKKPAAGIFLLYGTACGPKGKQPNLSNSGIPTVGKTYAVTGSGASPTKPALLTLGASKSKWGPFTLPFDLTPFGASGCQLLASVDVTGSALTSSAGSVSFSIPVPNQPSLSGIVFNHQIWVFDPTVNKLGIAFSRGATVTLGG
jgi:hypothetical protein